MKKILGSLLFLAILAWPSTVSAKTVIPFTGSLDLKLGKAVLSLDHESGQAVSVKVERSGPKKYHLSLDVSHVQTPFFDLSTILQGDFEVIGPSPERQEFIGEVTSRYTLINYQPIHDLYLKFAIRDRKLVISSFLAGALSASGWVDLVGDKKIDLSCELLSANLEDMMGFVGPRMKMNSADLSGVVTGVINLKGFLRRLEVRGKLAAYNGRLKELDYESILLDFEGTYPLLRLKDAAVTQAEGMSVNLSGAIDLSDLDQLGAQLRLLKRIPIVSDTGDRREWVFKRMSAEGEMRTEMKYYLMKDDRGDASAVLGVQKSIGF